MLLPAVAIAVISATIAVPRSPADQSASFIYYGKNATEPFPYQARLLKHLNGQWSFFCGGALVTLRHVVTAAHCLNDDPDPSLYKIIMGDLKYSVTEPSEQFIEVKRLALHPEFDLEKDENDIAVLELSSPVKSTQYAHPVSLARADVDGVLCRMSGWGQTETAPAADNLHYVDIMTYANENCRKSHEGEYLCMLDDKTGASSCSGDSGGPIVCPIDGQTLLSGVVSHRDIKDCGTGETYISNIAHFRQWIESEIARS